MDRDGQFKAVIEANRDRIYRVCCCYVHDDHERQDVCQEVMVHVWRNLSDFRGRSRLSTWIYRITVNTCLDHLRATQRRNRLIDERLAEDTPTCAVATFELDHELEDDVRRLHECVRLLPTFEKALISLYLEDLGTREMAAVLGISEGNVRVKLHRTKKRLKNLWEGNQHGS
ncbi:MAG: RNA polymerase sigma factor [Sedimentisphaerales bacterium]|nr:RNA polymerase sigma factor [Sedimentisphaerales bacterium]